MKNDKAIRDELIFQLEQGNAHMSLEEAVKNFPENKMNAKFTNGVYTFWHLLEHIRRTQNDILEFIKNPEYEEHSWPEDYWPERNEAATKKDWEASFKGFLKDREGLVKIIKNPKTDLYRKIPWGSGQTIMREIIVIVDHNSYHLGEFAIMKQTLGVWEKGPR